MTVRRLSALFLLLCPVLAAALPPHSPRPGGIAVIELPPADSRPTATLDGRPVMVTGQDSHWVAIVGIPLTAEAGTLELTVNGAPLPFPVTEHHYREQRLTVERQYVEPDPAQVARITREREVLDAALGEFSAPGPSSFSLPAPVPGRQSDSFGFRRVFNDQPRRPHSGMDISAPAGTPVRAPLGGRVTATGDFYFNGNTVIVDHGQGFISAYLHLDRIDVETGQSVDAGQALGIVGATGRVTGAHLHFGTYLNGTAIDPALFLVSQ